MLEYTFEDEMSCGLQGSHCTGKTGKVVKIFSKQEKQREFENFGRNTGITQGI